MSSTVFRSGPPPEGVVLDSPRVRAVRLGPRMERQPRETNVYGTVEKTHPSLE